MQVLKEEIRNTIIRCAEQLFAKNGYDSTSVEEIAIKAQISKGNIYLYFKNKRELFTAVVPGEIVETVTKFVGQRIKALLNPVNGSSIHKKAGEELIRFLIENRGKVLIMLNPENSKVTNALREKIVNDSCEAYQEFCARNQCPGETNIIPVHSILIKVLYDNIITKIGQILEVNCDQNGYMSLLQNLLRYHYSGMLAISQTITKENRL